jgi:serine/threonine protein kinase
MTTPRRRHRVSARPSTSERRAVRLPDVPYLTFGACLGEGHFSHVYQGFYHETRPAAIKVIERGSERIVEKEIDLLTRLRGLPHIIQLYEVIRSDGTLLVFELLNDMDESAYYENITVDRFRHVLRCLLVALKSAHDAGVVHRDVKLGNILISPDWAEVRLIDWGCGCLISDHMSHRAGSRSIRSIEMLMGYDGYGTGADMWAVGVLILTTLCGGDHPWRCDNSWETVIGIARYMGSQAVHELAKRYGLDMPDEVAGAIYGMGTQSLSQCFDRSMAHLRDPRLIDLMARLIAVKLEERLNPEAALAHPFFQIDESGVV